MTLQAAARTPTASASIRGTFDEVPSALFRLPHARPLGAHQCCHYSQRLFPLVHQLMAFPDVLERVRLAQTRVDLSIDDHLVERPRLLIVREMRALQPLLPHPEVAQVDGRVEAAGPRADHDHSARVAPEDRRGDRVLARVLEHDAWAPALAQDLPELCPECPRPLRPPGERLIVRPVRQHPPMVELFAVDAALRPQLQAEVELVLARHDRNRYPAKL